MDGATILHTFRRYWRCRHFILQVNGTSTSIQASGSYPTDLSSNTSNCNIDSFYLQRPRQFQSCDNPKTRDDGRQRAASQYGRHVKIHCVPTKIMIEKKASSRRFFFLAYGHRLWRKQRVSRRHSVVTSSGRRQLRHQRISTRSTRRLKRMIH